MFRARDLRLIVPVLGLSALVLTLALPAAAQEAAPAASAAPAEELPKIPNS